MIAHFFTILSILFSFIAIGSTFRFRHRQKLLHKHLLACRQLQLDSVEAMKLGDMQQCDLLLAAAQGELEQAQRYQ